MPKVVGLITARSGSKGFPDKNIALLNGITLIDHAIIAGKSSSFIEELYISTDSVEYEKIAVYAGAKSLGLRPESLASDSARSIDVIKNFIEISGLNDEDIIVLLQPTSPVRTGKQIDSSVMLHQKYGESVASVAIVDEPNPYKLKVIDEKNTLKPFIRCADSEIPRQELPKSYQLTGGIYVSSVSNILKKGSLFSDNTLPLIVEDFCNVDSCLDLEFLKFRCERGLTW
jgi:CMP-N,N'-diacetyllegionaminic acid synthase